MPIVIEFKSCHHIIFSLEDISSFQFDSNASYFSPWLRENGYLKCWTTSIRISLWFFITLNKSQPVYAQFIPKNPTCHQCNCDKQSLDITTPSCHTGGQQLCSFGGVVWPNSRAGECPSMPAGQADKESFRPPTTHFSISRNTLINNLAADQYLHKSLHFLFFFLLHLQPAEVGETEREKENGQAALVKCDLPCQPKNK